MKEIALTQGRFAIVDDSDFEWLNQWKWCFDGAYAASRIDGRKVRLHRFLLNEPQDMQIDHRDQDKLNCMRSNLRVCRKVDNDRNKGPQSNSTSGLKGVYWCKKNSKWQAQIKVWGKKYHLGYFMDKSEAAEEYRRAAIKFHGEFAGA